MLRAAAIAATLLALGVPAPAAAAPAGQCGHSGYSYAGLAGFAASTGVAATIRLNATPGVQAGHVAAWVGHGGYGAGPGGTNAWIQAGIITKAGLPPMLYYEVTRPRTEPQLVLLGQAETGRDYRFAVREARRHDHWRVEIDGRDVAGAVLLPGSHLAWEPTATTESWDDNQRVCNRLDVGFRNVEMRGEGGHWHPFRGFAITAPGYAVTSRTSSGFRAVG